MEPQPEDPIKKMQQKLSSIPWDTISNFYSSNRAPCWLKILARIRGGKTYTIYAETIDDVKKSSNEEYYKEICENLTSDVCKVIAYSTQGPPRREPFCEENLLDVCLHCGKAKCHETHERLRFLEELGNKTTKWTPLEEEMYISNYTVIKCHSDEESKNLQYTVNMKRNEFTDWCKISVDQKRWWLLPREFMEEFFPPKEIDGE